MRKDDAVCLRAPRQGSPMQCSHMVLMVTFFGSEPPLPLSIVGFITAVMVSRYTNRYSMTARTTY